MNPISFYGYAINDRGKLNAGIAKQRKSFDRMLAA